MPPPSLEVLNDAIRREDDPARLAAFLRAREAIYGPNRRTPSSAATLGLPGPRKFVGDPIRGQSR